MAMFPPVLWKFCNQILPTFQVRFPGDSQSLCRIPGLRSLMWGLEPYHQCENFFGIMVLQFVSHLLGSSMVGLLALGRANGSFLQEVLCHTLCLPGPLLPTPLSQQQATTDPCLCRRLSNTHAGLAQSLVGSLLLSPGSLWVEDFVCALQEWNMFPPVL